MYEKLSRHNIIILIERFIPSNLFGIDLYNYNKDSVIEKEQEVVFPMIKEGIKYEEIKNLQDYVKY